MESDTLDWDDHWSESLETYENHPTSRHRRRFVMRALRKAGVPADSFVFDYGCGTGLLLREIQDRYRLPGTQIGGCDLAARAVRAAGEAFGSPYFFADAYPDLDRPIDVAVTTEVIEHTDQYEQILTWLRDHLRPGGTLVVTTPGGTMDPPDVYYGHVQHFRLQDLERILTALGFELLISRTWGFPFFTLQKWVTKRYFDKIKREYIVGGLTFKKRLIFLTAYYVYMLHDLIPYGPQIFILAKRKG